MEESCRTCRTVYQREPGFFLGAIYFNYGLTALIVTVAYIVLTVGQLARPSLVMLGTLTFVVLFPLWFFRYARSLWLGFDQFVDPRHGASTPTGPDKPPSPPASG